MVQMPHINKNFQVNLKSLIGELSNMFTAHVVDVNIDAIKQTVTVHIIEPLIYPMFENLSKFTPIDNTVTIVYKNTTNAKDVKSMHYHGQIEKLQVKYSYASSDITTIELVLKYQSMVSETHD